MQQWVDSCDRLFFIEFDRHQRKASRMRHVWSCSSSDQTKFPPTRLHLPIPPYAPHPGEKKQDMIRIEKAWRGTCGKSTLERSVTGFVRKDSWQRFHHVPLISVLQLISRFLPWRTLRATYSFSFTWIKTRIECKNMQKTVRVILARDANIMYILYYIYILYI